jgi:hypothetical protein
VTSECGTFDFWSTDVIADKRCLRKAAMRASVPNPHHVLLSECGATSVMFALQETSYAQ